MDRPGAIPDRCGVRRRGSRFLAAASARETLTYGQEALAWATPWLVAVALWVLIGAGIGGEDSGSGWLLPLWFGLVIATPCYVVRLPICGYPKSTEGSISGKARSGVSLMCAACLRHTLMLLERCRGPGRSATGIRAVERRGYEETASLPSRQAQVGEQRLDR